MKFLPISHWMNEVVRTQPALEEDILPDVAIIGGGFTGLSVALALSARGYSVAVLEANLIGSGASGRNCGQIGADIGKNLAALEGDIGPRGARQVTRLLRDAIRHLDSFVEENEIDCDYRRTGNIFAGVHARHEGIVRRVEAAAAEFGFPIEPLSQAALKSFGISPTVTAGFHDKIGGTIDPGKLVRGMRDVAANKPNITLYECSPVVEIQHGARIRLKTPRATIESPICVIATNAYSNSLGLLKSVLFPVSVSVAVTKPLTESQLSRLGWRDVHGLYTAHHVLENLRLTADNRILVGTKRVRRGYGNRNPAPNDGATFVALENTLRDRFPALRGITFDSGWTGQVAVTTDNVPVIGTLGQFQNVFYSAGYSGHGIAMASYAGKYLSALVAAENLGDAEILRRKISIPVAPEPLRWLGTGALFGLWHFQDWLVDNAVRRDQRPPN